MRLAEAAEQLGVTTETVRRWCISGCNSVILDAVRVGKRWDVTDQAIQQFQRALTEAARGGRPVETSATVRDRVQAARARLGIPRSGRGVRESHGAASANGLAARRDG